MKFLLMALAPFMSLFLAAQQKQDWANFSRYADANKTVLPGNTVFMGNSITEGWYNTHPDFFSKNNYVCRGISGQTSSQMLVRFRQDVINIKPRTVVILAGTNDIAQNTGYISLENIMGNIKSMVQLARANHIKVVLCSILPAYEFSWRKELKPAEDIVALNKMIRAYALKEKLDYVDYHTALKDERNGLPLKYATDGVHPTPEAYSIMEALILKTLHVKKK